MVLTLLPEPAHIPIRICVSQATGSHPRSGVLANCYDPYFISKFAPKCSEDEKLEFGTISVLPGFRLLVREIALKIFGTFFIVGGYSSAE
jgi:hypothetical protein